MILDSLTNSSQYYALHPRIEQAFEYLKSLDLHSLPVGKLEIDGKNLFLSVAEMPVKTKEESQLEIHRQYIDIQIPIDGVELMGWKSSTQLSLPVGVYESAKDYQFYNDLPTNYIEVKPFEFAIFFPSDAHQPGITTVSHKKLIVKILL
jgi:YhcH/YjgK/YiaL family protein